MNIEKQMAIIGLGYVGLPLAVEFSKKYKVVGFDINTNRVNELKEANDKTLEVDYKRSIFKGWWLYHYELFLIRMIGCIMTDYYNERLL
jgi:hypothetical protein